MENKICNIEALTQNFNCEIKLTKHNLNQHKVFQFVTKWDNSYSHLKQSIVQNQSVKKKKFNFSPSA